MYAKSYSDSIVHLLVFYSSGLRAVYSLLCTQKISLNKKNWWKFFQGEGRHILYAIFNIGQKN